MPEDSVTRVPTSKAGRHAAIQEILATHVITSQPQLRDELRAMGFDAAQATLSRDLVELRATKVRDGDGRLVYALTTGYDTPHIADNSSDRKLQRWAQDLLVGAATAGNLIVLRTPAGAANLLGSALDAARHDAVVGTVAGDDTVLVICGSEAQATEYAQLLMRYAEGTDT